MYIQLGIAIAVYGDPEAPHHHNGFIAGLNTMILLGAILGLILLSRKTTTAAAGSPTTR